MPLTTLGMGAGALAISGIPPLAGFLSKDEILYKVFLEHRVLWGVAVATSLLTAFYMIRLMAHVFFGKYRGPRWQAVAAPASAAAASAHRVAHPADPHAHGQAQRAAHDVSHGAADSPGHAWMGPHESPRSSTTTSSAASRAAFAVSATTKATASPTWRTMPSASAKCGGSTMLEPSRFCTGAAQGIGPMPSAFMSAAV